MCGRARACVCVRVIYKTGWRPILRLIVSFCHPDPWSISWTSMQSHHNSQFICLSFILHRQALPREPDDQLCAKHVSILSQALSAVHITTSFPRLEQRATSMRSRIPRSPRCTTRNRPIHFYFVASQLIISLRKTALFPNRTFFGMDPAVMLAGKKWVELHVYLQRSHAYFYMYNYGYLYTKYLTKYAPMAVRRTIPSMIWTPTINR